MAEVTKDDNWNDEAKCKLLMLEHHMAAKRMLFQHIFEPLSAVEDFRTGLLDGSFPALRIFTQSILPLVTAQQQGDRFTVAKIVRECSPLLSLRNLKISSEPRQQLKIAQAAVNSLMSLWADGVPSCGAILENIAASNLFVIPDILEPLLALRRSAAIAGNGEDSVADALPAKIVALEEFLNASFSEVFPYAQYVSGVASFDTHQGVKGLEFERVMVLMDDSEARGFLFGYEKFFGAKEQSATDIKNEREGKETTLDRTRRLFYVTCSRARSSLALVAYSVNPAAVKAHVIRNGWFEDEEVVLHF